MLKRRIGRMILAGASVLLLVLTEEMCMLTAMAAVKPGSTISTSLQGMSAVTGRQIELPPEDEADPEDYVHNGAGAETVLGSTEGITAQEFFDQMEDLTIVRLKGEKENWGYTNLGIADVDESLNVRKTPGENAEKVGELPGGGACEILEEEDGWYHIKSGKVDGYVSSMYILTGEEAKAKAQEDQKLTALVLANALKVRKQPDTEHGTWAMVYNGNSLDVKEVLENGWVSVVYEDGEKEAYVSGDYVDINYSLDTALTQLEVLYGKGVSDLGIDLAERAVQYVGCPYVYGGTSLTNGTDCSGFTMLLMKKYGIKLPHSARAQSRMGEEVSLNSLRPGDLIFYANSTGVNHVTIYIGGGRVCHASSPSTGIKISDINYRSAVGARRFF